MIDNGAEDDNYVRDASGLIDDFSAPPGAVGHPTTRHIVLYAEFNRVVGHCLRELKRLKFSKKNVEKAMTRLIDEVYDDSR